MGTKTSAENNLAAGSIDGTEEVRIAKSGSNFRVAFSSLLTWLAGSTGFLKRDGSTTGATGAIQQFDKGVKVEVGDFFSYINENGQVAASNTNTGTFCFLDPDGTVVSSNGVQSTKLNPNGSVEITTGNSPVNTVNVITSTLRIRASSLDIQGMNVTPIELVPAPGADKIVRLIDAVLKYNAGSEAFEEIGEILLITESVSNPNTQNQKKFSNGIVTGSESTIRYAFDMGDSIDAAASTLIENKALQAISPNGSASGNGTIDFVITYQIISL